MVDVSIIMLRLEQAGFEVEDPDALRFWARFHPEELRTALRVAETARKFIPDARGVVRLKNGELIVNVTVLDGEVG